MPFLGNIRRPFSLLTWIEWCEVEVQSFPDLVERMRRLRGAVMMAGVFG